MQSIRWLAAILVLMTISGASIVGMPHPSPGRIPMSIVAPSGVLPTIVHHTGKETVDAYAAALTHADALAAVPCTCGCMTVLDHTNNLDCYIDEVFPGGAVAFSTHGLYCLVCQWITRDVVEAVNAGQEYETLTEMVLERYGTH
jgi:hypothetical protein